MRPIDADALEPDTEWDEYYDGFLSYSKANIDAAPTIQVGKHGNWIPAKSTFSSQCSECKKYSLTETPFCPQCGAKMIGSEDDD